MSGENFIKTDNIDLVLNNFYLSNVSSDGSITLIADDLNPLYTVKTVYKDGDVYFTAFRETDYNKLLGSKTGNILNSMRRSGLNSNLIKSLDRAGSISDLYSIMDKSIVFNPINLMRPIKTFDNFQQLKFKNETNQEFNISPLYITGNGLDLYGASSSVSFNQYNWRFLLSGYISEFKQSDDINEFSGTLYGGNINSSFYNQNIFVDILLGYTKSGFKTSGVFDGDNLVSNPNGDSLYGSIDSGFKMYADNFYIKPFAGMGASRQSVLSYTESDVYARIGGVAGFAFNEMGIRYDYGLFTTVQTNSIQSIGAKMEFLSIEDSAGGSVSYEILNEEIGVSHKISGNVRILF